METKESVWSKDVRLTRIWPVIWFGAVITAIFVVGIVDQVQGLGPENFGSVQVDDEGNINAFALASGSINRTDTGWAACYANRTAPGVSNRLFYSDNQGIPRTLVASDMAVRGAIRACDIGASGSVRVIAYSGTTDPGGACPDVGDCYLNMAVSTTDGDSWAVTERVIHNSTFQTAGSVSLHVVSTTEWYVTSAGNTASTGRLFFARTTDGGATYVNTTIQSGTFELDVGPKTIFRVGAKIYVSYVEQDSPFNAELRNSTDNGATWGTPSVIRGSTDNFGFGIIVGDDGSYNAVTPLVAGGNPEIRRSTDDGQIWTTVASQGGGPGVDPHTLVKTTGGTLVWVMDRDDGIGDQVIRRSFDNGTTWEGLETVLADAQTPACSPQSCIHSIATDYFDGFAVLHVGASTISADSADRGLWVTASAQGFELVRTLTDFQSIRDVRTDYTNGSAAHAIYTYDAGANLIEKFTPTFSNTGNILACGGTDAHGGTLTPTTFAKGLSVSFDSWIAHTCDSDGAPGASTVVIRRPSFAIERDFSIIDATNGTTILESRALSSYTCMLSPDLDATVLDGVTCIDAVTISALTETKDIGNQVDDIDIDKSDTSRRLWFTGPSGTKSYNLDTSGLLFNDPSEVWEGIATFANKVYVSEVGSVRRYNFTAGALVGAVDNTDPAALQISGLRASKDGAWLMAWSNSFVWVFNTTDMSTLGATPEIAPGIIVSADMDWTNSFLYVVTNTTLFQFDVREAFGDAGGTGGVPVGESPADVGDNTEGTSGDEDADPDENPPFVPPGIDPETGLPIENPGFFGNVVQIISDSWGFTAAGSAILIAILIISIIVYQFSKISVAPVVMGAAFILGVALVFQLNLIPIWLLFILGLLITAFVSMVFFHDRGGSDRGGN